MKTAKDYLDEANKVVKKIGVEEAIKTVSYTHLTLPTKQAV